MPDNLQPLEKSVRDLLIANTDMMPIRRVNYWARYMNLLSGLREHVYPNINAGLACLSKSPGIYTDHSGDHFDEVVRYAGLLLDGPDNINPLQPYELYLLLCAIRLHDAGNIEGRDEHERRASTILGIYGGNIVHDAPEFDLISKIAEAHGGCSPSGDKDTISTLPSDDLPIGGITCRPRHVAALVRFADEVCEHRGRAAAHHIHGDTLPEENKLYHYYASSITGAVFDRKVKSFRLNIDIDAKYLRSKYPKPVEKNGTQEHIFLIDEIRARLTKLDRERIYCNLFLDPRLQTNQIEVQIKLHDIVHIGDNRTPSKMQVDSFPIKIPPESGYPDASTGWQSKCTEMTGKKIAARANKGWK